MTRLSRQEAAEAMRKALSCGTDEMRKLRETESPRSIATGAREAAVRELREKRPTENAVGRIVI